MHGCPGANRANNRHLRKVIREFWHEPDRPVDATDHRWIEGCGCDAVVHLEVEGIDMCHSAVEQNVDDVLSTVLGCDCRALDYLEIGAPPALRQKGSGKTDAQQFHESPSRPVRAVIKSARMQLAV